MLFAFALQRLCHEGGRCKQAVELDLALVNLPGLVGAQAVGHLCTFNAGLQLTFAATRIELFIG